MHPSYQDIIDRLGEPLWWYRPDAAFPRYEPFHPNLLGVYDAAAALVIIECQACRRTFPVSVSFPRQVQVWKDHKLEFRPVVLPTKESPGSFDVWATLLSMVALATP